MNYSISLIPILISFLSLTAVYQVNACTLESNDSCDSAIELLILGNVQTCIQGCSLNANPGLFDKSTTGCNGSPFGTVWYQVAENTNDRILNLEISSSELSIPLVTVYYGDCNSLLIQDCNQKRGSVNLRNLKIKANEKYFLAVSSADGSEGEFDLCYTIEDDPNVCNTSSTLVVKSTSKGSPLNGPFRADETVEFCYTINGFKNEACNYLQAIQPIFGEGWSEDSFEASGMPTNITQPLVTQGHTEFPTEDPVCEGDPAGSWEWYPSKDIRYNLNSDNPMNFKYEDVIPASWVFLSSFDPTCFNFDDACCTNPTSDPNLGYGDDDYPICWKGETQTWTLCFTLKTKASPVCPAELDCKVGLKSYSDGEIGVLISRACSSDIPSYINATLSCCDAPSVTSSRSVVQVCPGESFQIPIETNSESRLYWFDSNDVLHVADGSSAILEGSHMVEGQYRYTVFSSNGCHSDPLIIEVEVSPELVSRLVQEPEEVCVGEMVTVAVVVDGIADGEQLSYLWNNTQSQDSSIQVVAYVGSEVTVDVNLGLCSAQLISNFNFYDESTVEIRGVDQVCQGEEAMINLFLGGVGPWEITLENNLSFSEELVISDSEFTIPYTVNEEAEFRISKAIDGNGCDVMIENEYIVSLAPTPQISAGDDVVLNCDTQPVVLEGIIELNISDYEASWAGLENQTFQVDGMEAIVSESGAYVFSVQDLSTGCKSVDTIRVQENPNDLVLDFSTDQLIEIEEGESIDLEVFYNRPDSEISFINWTGDAIDCNTCNAVTLSPTTDIMYSVEVMDNNNCTEVKTIQVVVNEKTPSIYLPTVFQPGLEGNETFRIFDNGTIDEITSFEIFDRWGQLVHGVYQVAADDSALGWDGRLRGLPLESGVYVYKISLNYTNDKGSELVVGTVTLL